MEHLTAVQYRIIQQLHAAHVAGLPELSLRQLGEQVSLSEEVVRFEVRRLVAVGVCDRMDSEEGASLSAAGLRIARRDSGAKPADRSEGGEGWKAGGAGGGAPVEATILLLRRALDGWSEVIARSNIASEEKQRLLTLGQDLFEHPAFFELVRRAIIRAEDGVSA